MGWIDRLNVEDVLRVLTSTDVKVRIVLMGGEAAIGFCAASRTLGENAARTCQYVRF